MALRESALQNPATARIVNRLRQVPLHERLRMVDERSAVFLKDHPWFRGKVPNGYWHNPENRKNAVLWLVEKLAEERGSEKREVVRMLTGPIFEENSLGGLINYKYKGHVYHALLEAGLAYSEQALIEHAKNCQFGEEKVYPWELKQAPHTDFYNRPEIRSAATRWLAWKVKKELGLEPDEIEYKHYKMYGLEGLLGTGHYVYAFSRTTKALREAGFV